MLTESGRVVAVEADAVWVETLRRSTCGACAAQSGCGHGMLNKVTAGRRGYVRALPGAGGVGAYRIGQQVLLGIPEEIVLRGSFIAYLLPLSCMLPGAVAAAYCWPGAGDPAAVAGAVVGLALGYVLVRRHGVRHRRDPDFQPVVLCAAGAQPEPVALS